jgi:iron(III) transport system substrate-binding protein
MRAAWHRRIIVIAALAATVVAAQASGQKPAGKLVLYTSQPERDAAQTVGAFKKVYPGIDVEVFRSGTTEVMGRLAAEFAGGASKADVLLLADAATMEALKKAGRLLAYPAVNVTGLDPASYDPDKTYFGSKLITTGSQSIPRRRLARIVRRPREARVQRAIDDAEPALFGRGGDHARNDGEPARPRLELSSRN